MRAVSAALSYIVLLGITLVLLVFVLQSFVDFQFQIKKPMADSLNTSKTISADYASAIGFLDVGAETESVYSSPDAALMKIETYPPYMVGERGTISIKITNPTKSIMQIPRLEISSGLFDQEYADIRIVYTESYAISFTPNSPGELIITAKIEGGEEAQEKIVVTEKEDTSPRLRGTINVQVDLLTTDSVSGTKVNFHCNYTNKTLDGSGHIDLELDFGCHNNSLAVGYFTGTETRYSGSIAFIPTIPGADETPESGYYSHYSHYYSWYSLIRATGHGVAWSNDTLCASASAWGESYDYNGNPTPSSATAKLFLLKLDTELHDMKRLYMALSNLLGTDYSGFLYPGVCSGLSGFEAVETPIEIDSIYRLSDHSLSGNSPTRIASGGNLVLFNNDEISIVPIYHDHLSLPNDFSGKVSIYLYSEHDLTIKLKLNRYWVTDWTDLHGMGQFSADISDFVIPGGIKNPLEIWIDPTLGSGSYTIQWGLKIE